MQQLSVLETTQRMMALNSTEKPYQYSVTGSQIIGNWKIADVKWAAILGAGSINSSYRIIIDLDETTHTFIYRDESTDTESTISVNANGIGFSQSKSWFVGKKKEVKFEMGLGTIVKWIGRKISHRYSYKFNTNDIKEPLFTTLSQAGWTKK